MIVGLPATVIAVMALLRPVMSAPLIQLVTALALSVLLPLLLVSRLFLDRPKREAKSLSRDVLALLWMSFAAGFFGVAHPYTRPWLGAEAQLFSASGFPEVAHAVGLVAAVRPLPTLVASPRVNLAPASSAAPSAVAASSASAAAPVPAPPSSFTADRPPPPPSPPRPEAPLAMEQLVERIAPTIVTVFVERPDGIATATGFFVDANGVVATTRSLVDQATAVAIKRQDGTWIAGAQLLTVSDGLDFALLRFALDGFAPTALVASSTEIPATTEVVSLARPLGLGMTRWVARVGGTTSGYVLVLDQDVPPHRAGSPVVNRFGDVVGMVTSPDRVAGSPLGAHGAVIGLEPVLRRLESDEFRPRTLGALPEQEML